MLMKNNRKEVVDFTYPYFIERATFTAPLPHYKHFANLFKTFDTSVWLSITASIVILLTLITMISKTQIPSLWRIITLLLYQTYKWKHMNVLKIRLLLCT